MIRYDMLSVFIEFHIIILQSRYTFQKQIKCFRIVFLCHMYQVLLIRFNHYYLTKTFDIKLPCMMEIFTNVPIQINKHTSMFLSDTTEKQKKSIKWTELSVVTVSFKSKKTFNLCSIINGLEVMMQLWKKSNHKEDDRTQ